MTENNIALDRPTRLKRLRMRAWRRGMKEMDLILGGFVDAHGASLDDEELTALELLMNRQDQQLFLWVTGAQDVADDTTEIECTMIARIVKFCTDI